MSLPSTVDTAIDFDQFWRELDVLVLNTRVIYYHSADLPIHSASLGISRRRSRNSDGRLKTGEDDTLNATIVN